jgi:hypothetical protein
MRSRCYRHSLLVAVLLAAVLLVPASPAHAVGTIKQVRIAEEGYGHHDSNTIKAPIFDATGVASLAIGTLTSSYDAKEKIVRGRGNIFTKGPTLKLDKKIALGELLAESMRTEAKAMGLPLAAADAAGDCWKVSGDLKDIYIESWQMTGYGNILFYGFADVTLEVQGPGGVAESRHYRIHGYHEEPGGGFSRTGKSEAALATLIVNGSQELLGRLNREFIKAKSAPDAEAQLAKLEAPGLEDQAADLRVIGLARPAGAETALLALLPKEDDSDGRILVLNALASIGSPDTVAPLVERYGQEDEQGRWYTLKALDYIGGEAGMALIQEKGPKDDEYSVKALAARILGTKVK